MKLVLIENMSPEVWDKEVEKYDTWCVYHSAAWLDFIEQTQPVKRHIYAIYSEGQRIGFLPGFVLRKGPFRIYGSPLPGWTTDYLGPLVNDVDQAKLLIEISRQLRQDGYCHAEFRHPHLNIQLAIKYGYKIERMTTYIASLQSEPEAMLANFSKSCRKAIRRAQRNNLEVNTTDDPAFIDIYYEQLREVFSKSKMVPTYPKSRVEVLWRCMMPKGCLIATYVRYKRKVIATRLDLCGRQRMHSFGSASNGIYLHLYPNELARFHAMCVAATRGLTHFDMSGGGDYKAKFGAKRISTYTLILSSRWFRSVKDLLRIWHHWKVRSQYKLKNSD